MKIVIDLVEPKRTFRPKAYVIEEGMYVVRRGDTLSAIASALGTTVANLAFDNNISNPDLILTGQRLHV